MVPTTEQLRAGRALLGWKLKALAHHAGQNLSDTSEGERGGDLQRAYLGKVIAEHGVRFIPGGVVLS